MADRPEILTAKLSRLIEMVAEQQEIKAIPKAERPGEASIDEVRQCGADCARSIYEGNFGSVAAVEQNTKLPSERLKGGST